MLDNSEQTHQIDLDIWREKIREGKIRTQSELHALIERTEEVKDELARFEHEESLIEQAVVVYQARITPERSPAGLMLEGTLKEILISNFADSEGTVIGSDAASRLTKAGYFKTRRLADGAVYTVLNRDPFFKVEAGIYRVEPDSDEWHKLRGYDWRQQTLAIIGSPSNGNGDPSKLVERDSDSGVVPCETDSSNVDFSQMSKRQGEIYVVVERAKRQGGKIRFSEAKEELLNHPGLSTKANQLGFIMRAVLHSSGRFKRISRGLYKLTEKYGG